MTGMTHERDDDAIRRITRAFDAAYMRFTRASSFDEQEDETSNLLSHLHRHAVHKFGETSDPGWRSLADATREPLRLVPALLWLRHKDIHNAVRVTRGGNVYTDIYTDLYGTLVWEVPELNDDRIKRYAVRELLDGKAVITTIRAASQALRGD